MLGSSNSAGLDKVLLLHQSQQGCAALNHEVDTRPTSPTQDKAARGAPTQITTSCKPAPLT